MSFAFTTTKVTLPGSLEYREGDMMIHNGMAWLLQGKIYEYLCDLDDNSIPPNAVECELIASFEDSQFGVLRENNIQVVKFIFPENRQLLLHIDVKADDIEMSLVINMSPINKPPKRKWMQYLPYIALAAITVPLILCNLFSKNDKKIYANDAYRFGNGKNNPQRMIY